MNFRNNLPYIIFVTSLLAIWEITGQMNINVSLLISTPSKSLLYMIHNFKLLIKASGITFTESILGLSIAIFISFIVMVYGLFNSKFLDFIMPIMIISQVIPIITLAPLIILIFGIGIKAKVIISALMCFFPIFTNFYNGIRNIPEDILDLMKIYNSTILFKIRHIYFPLSTPNIFTGLKISSVLSVIGAIVGEFNGTDFGLGKNLFLAAKRLEPELMMSSLFFSSLIGLVIYTIIILVELKIGKWYNLKIKDNN